MARGTDSRFHPRRLVGRGKIKLKEVDMSGEGPTPVPKHLQRGEAKGRTPQAQRTHDIVEGGRAENQVFHRIPRPTSADDASYQTPEGTDGHYGDNFQPKRKGTGNILVDPVGNQWSNSTDSKDWL